METGVLVGATTAVSVGASTAALLAGIAVGSVIDAGYQGFGSCER
jgi:hypothetical protein